MVDLVSQYQKIKIEVDQAISEVLEAGEYIKGKKVELFQQNLSDFLNVRNVISCGNGTDALQISMMSLDLKAGDEVIIPAFTYAATAEVIGLLGLRPVMVDVNEETFNIAPEQILNAITPKTKAIVPVNLFGQCADLEKILEIANLNNLFVIEDNAQAMGADYLFSNGNVVKSGCVGDIGCTSFFPSKNLGCYGDGGAMYTNNVEIASKLKMIANHGQATQYCHEIIGVNSRLDNIQAAILIEKLKNLENYNEKRVSVANEYDKAFSLINGIKIPIRSKFSTHVFHQYTIRVLNKKRDKLKIFLASKGIPSMIYYPKPLHYQEAYKGLGKKVGDLKISERLCDEVLSLPIHTEIGVDQLDYIIENIKDFFND